MNPISGAPLPPARNFGLLLAVVCVGLAGYGFWKDWTRPLVDLLMSAGLLSCGLVLIAPGVLAPLNQAWFRLGAMMARIVNPVVLGTIFFGLLTPVAIASRLLGRDELGLKKVERDSYWYPRSPSRFDLESFKRQF